MGAFRISAEPPGYRQAPTTANAGKDKKRRTQNEAEENFNAGSVGSDGDRVADVCQLWTDRYGAVSYTHLACVLDNIVLKRFLFLPVNLLHRIYFLT